MILPALKFVVFSLAPFLLLLWSTSPNLWKKISLSARLVGRDPSSLWDLHSGLLFSGEAVVKSLTCDDLDLSTVDYASPVLEEAVPPMRPLPSVILSPSVPLGPPKVSSPAPTRTPWLLTSLILMGLNAYFPQLSLVSSLWSPLQVAIPVLHWMASWWFVSPGWEPNLVSLAPLSHMNGYLHFALADTQPFIKEWFPGIFSRCRKVQQWCVLWGYSIMLLLGISTKK
ncbi:hypothetical protein DSO57_1016978 [Entomophthora muscae]|uniref:Uncharacterized protein n=1 Tax=Entomophthora muscae TaxID=34485 RepID=A0ACC2UQD9_9FUNG|nr:hypothetical protein DSO57_1016978 [Entomophthora muscae]